MTKRLAVIGGGGFGREVLDLVDAINLERSMCGAAYEVVGVFDDGEPDPRLLKPYEVQHLGPVMALHDQPADVGYVIGIGNPHIRAAIDAHFRGRRESPVLIHPSATCGRAVEFGPGVIVCAGARLTNHIRLGRHVHVNLNCTIGHDSTLNDFVTLSPLVAISGNVHAEQAAFFGTGALVNPGVHLGQDVVVGTGAAVIQGVGQGTTVVGVPAKPL